VHMCALLLQAKNTEAVVRSNAATVFVESFFGNRQDQKELRVLDSQFDRRSR